MRKTWQAKMRAMIAGTRRAGRERTCREDNELLELMSMKIYMDVSENSGTPKSSI